MDWFSVHVEMRGDEPRGMTEDELGKRLGDQHAAVHILVFMNGRSLGRLCAVDEGGVSSFS